ncbi:MAG: glycosyltransferase family 4 protein [Candidatus Omnitrophica bacterium]|nr:glycosyltransferase family 4 protein [Candidatus Omnitrophota bacterium]
MPADIDLNGFHAPNIATVHHVDEGLRGYGEKEELSKILFASQCDAIQVVSGEWKCFVESKTDKPVFLAHHVINPRLFIPHRKVKKPRKPFRIGAFGFSTGIKDRKRLDVLLAALHILVKKQYQFELIVQGSFWNTLESSLSGQGIQIRNLGFLPRKMAFKSYRYLDLYVCSSDIEGGPLPVLEALASGVPVVSTQVGVAIEALSQGGGILVKKGSPEDLASAIAKVMDHPGLFQDLSLEAGRVSENFTWEKIGKEYMAMYESVLNSKRSRPKFNVVLKFPKFQRQLQLFRDTRRLRLFKTKTGV